MRTLFDLWRIAAGKLDFTVCWHLTFTIAYRSAQLDPDHAEKHHKSNEHGESIPAVRVSPRYSNIFERRF